ncbi:MAG: proton-conducting transporter membrane subunit [Anaerolineales bacterium]
MIIPGALLIIGLPLGVAFIALLLMPIRLLAMLKSWLVILTTGFIGVIVTAAPLNDVVSYRSFQIILGRPMYLLGREMVIEPVDRLPLAFLFFTATGLFILAWRLIPRSNFFPFGLMMIALLAGALMVKQVVYAALLVEMAAILAVFPLHAPRRATRAAPTKSLPKDQSAAKEPTAALGQRESASAPYSTPTQGGLRYISYMFLALPGLMITHLLLELFIIFPNDLGLLQSATALLGISFAILLGAIPFQSWVSTVAMDGSPPVVTFLFTVNLGTVWFMLLAYLESYTWLSQQAAFGPLFTIIGLLMMGIGGLLAASQRRLGRLLGYATLVDNGAMFVALGAQQVAGLTLMIMMLLARPFALGLMAVGLDGLRRLGGGEDRPEAVRGGAWRAPWRALAFLVGGIAMAGFPISLGFTARWGLYRILADGNLLQALTALLGSAGVMMGLINAIENLLTDPTHPPNAAHPPALAPSRPRPALQEDTIVVIMIILLMGMVLGLGIFPHYASRVALQIAEGFTFLSS